MDTAGQRIELLFETALELKDPASRAALLDRECAGNSALRLRLERLLSAHEQSNIFFADCLRSLAPAQSHEAPGETVPTDELPGRCIGAYKLLQKIGEGGCGAVYMAQQERPVRRRVALKIIKLGMDTKSVIARFELERQALAMMDHPNIARVLEAGATETGRPYFVMELVHGVRITDYCDERRLDTRARLDLFIQVCHAIQHAHQKGIIHRDIKPSNILVTHHDGVPVPKVIDFGIAKAIEEKLTDKTLFTIYGNFIGTPAYMSPEQAECSGLDIDTRSDIYSLGVLLYELLTGKTPFEQNELLASGLDEMRKTLREREPHRPSTRLDTFRPDELTATALRRHIEPPKLQLLLKGDLDWIVMKALEKDRRRRYETANGLVMDVRRFLGNEPVLARPPSGWYRLAKLIRRNRGVFAAVSAVVLALVLGLGASTWLFFQERKAEHQQVRLRHEAENREKMTQAALLASQGRFDEAEKLAASISFDQPSLENSAVLRSLGEWHALQGRWTAAVGYFRQLQHINQLDGWDIQTLDYFRYAAVLAQLGDLSGYEKFRREAISRFFATVNPLVAERIMEASLLLPADAEVLNRLAALAHVTQPGPGTGATNQLLTGIVWRRTGSGDDGSGANTNLVLMPGSAGPILSGTYSFDGRSVGVEFTEPVDPASATAKENYLVSGSSVTNVTVGPDDKTVVLWLSSKLAGDFSVSVQNVRRLTGQPAPGGSIGGMSLDLRLQDIDTGQPYSVSYQGGMAQMVAGGEDIWEKADHFVYLFTKVTGDFDYRLRVISISPTSENFARAGLMARESFSAPGSREVMVAANAQNTFQALYRSETGGDAASQPPNPLPVAGGSNSWVRLQRLGSDFHCYTGTNGIDWNELYLFNSAAGTEGPFGDQIYVGIAISSHTAKSTVTGTVNDFGVNPNVNMMLPLALLEYRLGHYAQSEEWCRQCLAYPEYNASRTAAARVILALDNQQQGQSEIARNQLALANDSINHEFSNGLNPGTSAQGFWFDWVIARLLSAQASSQTH